MSASIESTFRSRLGKVVKKDKLDQLIEHYATISESEAIVNVGSQISDDKLFFGFVTGVPSFRKVYTVLEVRDLEQVVGVSQKLELVSPKVSFGFLRFGGDVLAKVPDYCKKTVLSMTEPVVNPFAVYAFVQNAGKIAQDAGKESVFKKWFDDCLSLSASLQVEHFGYDTVSQAVLNYFKHDGGVFPLSTLVRPFADYGIGVVDAVAAFERQEDKLIVYLDPEGLVHHGSEYVKTKDFKCSDGKEFDIAGINSQNWEKLNKFKEELVEYIYGRKYKDLPDTIKNACMCLPPKGKVWPVGRGSYDYFSVYAYDYYVRASRGVVVECAENSSGNKG